ncbi:uncharacterized protein HMPREF1541_00839 [Cyphellophora europaea CBS 101466]|uniref:NmrA-like domain-containing protein n=1 Tax=Cyphellophora europaea (strain CBS 101466) TaxID=1220924 RepID=W2SF43_CYPE1|nr:uncharacterized protein HMPREF1541_00839 [Cyphellophora europaea CBS 101466]ETN46653.1 hypothetical protein HMPREF1541_00839 [Cyphellophora europaea CBS 101466]
MSNNTAIKNVILVGAAGNVGAGLVAPLASVYNITILTRESSTSTFPEGIKVIRAAYTVDGLTEAFRGQDAVVSAVGGGGLVQQTVLIDAAVQAGVKRFLPSELSMSSTTAAFRELVPVFQWKWEVLEYLKAKEKEGLSWTGIATGPFIDWGLNAGFLGFDIPNQKAKIWDGGKGVFSAITVADMGKAVVGALKNPEATKNKYIFAYSVTTSQTEILAELEKATAQKWQVESVTSADDIEEGRKLVAAGDFVGMYKLVQAATFGGLPGLGQNFERDEKDGVANDVLGIKPTSIEDIVAEVIGSTERRE